MLESLRRGPAILAALIVLQASDFSCSTGGDSLGPGVSIQVSGVVRFAQIEGGCWVLRADDGTVYELRSDKVASIILVDGARVSVMLRPRSDLSSTCMLGQIADVEAVESVRLP